MNSLFPNVLLFDVQVPLNSCSSQDLDLHWNRDYRIYPKYVDTLST